MNHYEINFRMDKEDHDYIRSISKGTCSMSEIYRSIYTQFCDSIRRTKKKGKKNVKANTRSKAQGGKKTDGGSKDKNPRGRRSASRKTTKGGKG